MKFAYLILAHGSFELLKELLKALDSPDNDIYVHIDKKAGHVDLSPFMEIVKQSKLCFIQNRVDVKWGQISLVEATLNLFAEAINSDYDYLHLLSGVDFPIKSHSYIQKFFQEHQGKEFVGFSKVLTFNDVKSRAICWLSPYENSNENRTNRVTAFRNKLIFFIRRKIHLHIMSPLDQIKLGSEWCSITKQLAIDLVNQRKRILKRFRFMFAADEAFIQTYLYENNYMDRVYNFDDEFESCCRFIDWNRGRPYVWQDNNFEELINSKYLWARKFSENNMDLIKRIANHIEEKAR